MRVSLSLSDRIPAPDWRNEAACRDMDPHDFDDMGTPVAWEACRERCPVRRQCKAAAREEHPRGVYRAGRYWPEKYGQADDGRPARWLEWAHMFELGYTPPQIAAQTGYHRASVRNALQKMGVA